MKPETQTDLQPNTSPAPGVRTSAPLLGISEALDRDRNDWVFGFTNQAENWNGRLAMIGFLSIILIELFTHKGVLHFWGVIASGVTPV